MSPYISTVERGVLRTHSGLTVNPDRPLPESIRLDDIIFGLSNGCRFAGQIRGSILEHSWRVYQYVRDTGGTVNDMLAALLHDATEAYYSDLPSPVKKRCPQYKRLETKLQKVIFTKYGLNPKIPNIVHWADDRALEDERTVAYRRDLSFWYPDNLPQIFKHTCLDLLEQKAFSEKRPKWLKPRITF